MDQIKEMRKEFEKMKNIKERIKRAKLSFDGDMDEFHTKSTNNCDICDEMYVNGAWWMFQELNK